jgi:glucose-1-phosphate thymidylyltransferase
MRGIILAGGAGTRLRPATSVMSKQLLPVYDKPMIYYPLSLLMLAGIREVLVISGPDHLPLYQQMLGDGGDLGIDLRYAVQDRPGGLPEAFLVRPEFVGDQPVCLVLGDNLFHGAGLAETLRAEQRLVDGCTLFGYPVNDPSAYGVACLDGDRLTRIDEKPRRPGSNVAITGLYYYSPDVVELAAGLRPSARGELEISDLNNLYISRRRARLVQLGRGTAWLDTGTHDNLLAAATYVQTMEQRRGEKIACVEEVAWRMGYVDSGQLLRLAERYKAGSEYHTYLTGLTGVTALPLTA